MAHRRPSVCGDELRVFRHRAGGAVDVADDVFAPQSVHPHRASPVFAIQRRTTTVLLGNRSASRARSPRPSGGANPAHRGRSLVPRVSISRRATGWSTSHLVGEVLEVLVVPAHLAESASRAASSCEEVVVQVRVLGAGPEELLGWRRDGRADEHEIQVRSGRWGSFTSSRERGPRGAPRSRRRGSPGRGTSPAAAAPRQPRASQDTTTHAGSRTREAPPVRETFLPAALGWSERRAGWSADRASAPRGDWRSQRLDPGPRRSTRCRLARRGQVDPCRERVPGQSGDTASGG